MLTKDDQETLRYLKNSSDALKRDAVKLIERLSYELNQSNYLLHKLQKEKE